MGQNCSRLEKDPDDIVRIHPATWMTAGSASRLLAESCSRLRLPLSRMRLLSFSSLDLMWGYSITSILHSRGEHQGLCLFHISSKMKSWSWRGIFSHFIGTVTADFCKDDLYLEKYKDKAATAEPLLKIELPDCHVDLLASILSDLG